MNSSKQVWSSLEIANKLKTVFDYKSEEDIIFDKYIDDNPTHLHRILSDSKGYILCAKMNSGKTYSVIKTALNYKIKTVLAVPLTILGNQKLDEFKTEGIKVQFVHGRLDQKNQEDLLALKAKLLKATVIICLYDSMLGLTIQVLKDQCENYTLVVDEAHNLVTQSNFRLSAIYSMKASFRKYKKVIYLSATPEFVVRDERASKVAFIKSLGNFEKPNVQVIPLPKFDLHYIVKHILSLNAKGKIVVLIDNKRQLEQIQKGLMLYRVNKNEISILSSEDKWSEAFLHLQREENIPEVKKYTLTTRVISDGINIKNKDIEYVYLIGATDIFLKRQFLGRFRNSEPKAFDVIFPDDELVNNDITNAESAIIRLHKQYHEELDIVNKNRSHSAFGIAKYNSRDYEANNFQPIFFNRIVGSYTLSTERIIGQVYDTIGKIIANNPEFTKTLYQTICGYNCEISLPTTIKLSKLYDEFGDWKFYDELKYAYQTITLDTKEAIEKNLSTILSMHLVQSIINDPDKKKKARKQIPSIKLHSHATRDFVRFDFDSSSIGNHKSLLSDKTNILNELLNLANYGYRYNFICFSHDKLTTQKLAPTMRRLLQRLRYYACSCALAWVPELESFVNAKRETEFNEYITTAAVKKSFKVGHYKKADFRDGLKRVCVSINHELKNSNNDIDDILAALFTSRGKAINQSIDADTKITPVIDTIRMPGDLLFSSLASDAYYDIPSILATDWDRIVYSQLLTKLLNFQETHFADRENDRLYRLINSLTDKVELLRLVYGYSESISPVTVDIDGSHLVTKTPISYKGISD